MISGGVCVSPECFRRSENAYSLGVGRSAFSVRCFSSMRIDIVTLFPEICRAPLSESMMKRAQENRIVELHIHNLRDWTTDKHHVVDDAPFGGGQGMVMKPEPIFAAVEALRKTRTSNAQRPMLNIRQSESKIENSVDVACRTSVGSTDGAAAVTRIASHNHFRTLRRSRSSRDRTSG